MIPHSRPLFGKAFSEALTRIVESGHVAMGSEALLLEQEVRQVNMVLNSLVIPL